MSLKASQRVALRNFLPGMRCPVCDKNGSLVVADKTVEPVIAHCTRCTETVGTQVAVTFHKQNHGYQPGFRWKIAVAPITENVATS